MRELWVKTGNMNALWACPRTFMLQAQDAMKCINSPRSPCIFPPSCVPGTAAVSIRHQATVKLIDNKCQYGIPCRREEEPVHKEEVHTFSSFLSRLHLGTGSWTWKNSSLSDPTEKDTLPQVFSYTVHMLLASRLHATHSFHSCRGLAVTPF